MIVRYAETAQRQLTEIWRFSRRQWGEARADRYIEALYESVRLAAEGRGAIQPRPEVRADLGIVRSGSHHIYVTLDAAEKVLHVVAILHQRMEPRRHIPKRSKGDDS
jgi:toxin ParE1/3/4